MEIFCEIFMLNSLNALGISRHMFFQAL